MGKVPDFKIIVVGNSGVGKTCLVMRAAKDIYTDQHPTIGFAFQKVHKLLNDQPLNLFIWDTAGYYHTFNPHFIVRSVIDP